MKDSNPDRPSHVMLSPEPQIGLGSNGEPQSIKKTTEVANPDLTTRTVGFLQYVELPTMAPEYVELPIAAMIASLIPV
ncbi:hypothetical protein [Roseomonas indoligenes]|uniref:Uncharacterized protein n=1 Tax=Roseomonas indoligenes TaxID=2820811 RepID=A0A940S5R3_9PROT|nr:hypothetical protein [Pararoseomonas indoligenes]MBP0494711.1 hypothetical protein [Pararoseomonas indoligenes]